MKDHQPQALKTGMNIPHTYQSLIQLMEHWILEMGQNVQTASRYIEDRHYDSAIGCLRGNRELLKILETLQEALFRIHRRE